MHAGEMMDLNEKERREVYTLVALHAILSNANIVVNMATLNVGALAVMYADQAIEALRHG